MASPASISVYRRHRFPHRYPIRPHRMYPLDFDLLADYHVESVARRRASERTEEERQVFVGLLESLRHALIPKMKLALRCSIAIAWLGLAVEYALFHIVVSSS
jgi:hypothetical protein